MSNIRGASPDYIAFDLDDVLANLRDELMAMLNRRTGRDVHWNDWREYELSGVYGTSTENIMQWIVDDRVLESALPETHARAALRAARAAGYRVAVVTARGWHPRGETLTHEWLKRHGMEVDELFLVPAFGSKKAVLRGLGVVSYFIDDHLGHLDPARELGTVRETLLVDRPWNQGDETHHRLYGLDQFIARLAPSESRAQA